MYHATWSPLSMARTPRRVFHSSRPPTLLGSTVEVDYGAAELERDRPNGPTGMPILRVRDNGHLCPPGNHREMAEIPTTTRESDEVVLDGEARGCRPRAHSELAVDGVEVPLDGAGAKKEPLSDLGIG